MKKKCEEPGHTILTVLRLAALLYLLLFLLGGGAVAAVAAVFAHLLG